MYEGIKPTLDPDLIADFSVDFLNSEKTIFRLKNVQKNCYVSVF